MRSKIFLFVILAVVLTSLLVFYESRKVKKHSLCKGSSRCFLGELSSIVDGDTLEVGDETVRLALINTPEEWEQGYEEAKRYLSKICPEGSGVLVDEDDLQISRSHRRIVAVVYCGDRRVNINEELLKNGHARILGDFCMQSEFSGEDWAKLYGC